MQNLLLEFFWVIYLNRWIQRGRAVVQPSIWRLKMKRGMEFETVLWSGSDYCHLPMRTLRLSEIKSFTLAKIFCESRQGINKIGKWFPKGDQLESMRPVRFLPKALPGSSVLRLAPGTAWCTKLSHRGWLSPGSHQLQYEIWGIKNIILNSTLQSHEAFMGFAQI